ncbi:gluzincin family metallopeptidase [Sphingomonas nostoxanthinifaciens]|uniref:hypothetical protein n=1 Tax=Sphingomonas nostoxanthinifaciens TaxID=2872652 RepID=UPI001CC1DDF7|nr:hypothetical protein [Sphingomonas nostoxanthinifaciens]UAK26325.1 hypothetical protein K8P63_09675 [Sphingomonas nostoxanthinifaciens]
MLKSRLIPDPPSRKLRVFAFDPQASIELETAVINDAFIELPWEEEWEDPITLGPTNEYIEVVDFDPASGCFYPPLDLNDARMLASEGLAPSDGNPQFHQQMAFAVAMKAIRIFERALGRPVLFMREKPGSPDHPIPFRRPVRRLRIYPHAMRERNAYYSPQKASLLFGYFRGDPASDGTGGGWVFTALSQDIVAHETTHAILHGMWPRSIESSNADSLAFHEAFADIVALLQHFTVGGVVRHEMVRYGGSLRAEGLLTGLAQQFGRGTGREGPLRFALGMVRDEEAALAAGTPLDPDRNAAVTEPHMRGQILVAAVFDTFVTMFERKTADLFRLSGWTRGTPDLPAELAQRLTIEACMVGSHVLDLCIRGLDYLPPIDVTFGEFLRAIITADVDLDPRDPDNYRVAFAEAFRKRGIRVRGASFSSTDSLLWEPTESFLADHGPAGGPVADGAACAASSSVLDASFAGVLGRLQLGVFFESMTINNSEVQSLSDYVLRETVAEFPGIRHYLNKEDTAKGAGDRPDGAEAKIPKANLRDLSLFIARFNAALLHGWLTKELMPEDQAIWGSALGLSLATGAKPSVFRLRGAPSVEIHSARISRRHTADGKLLQQLIVQVAQRRRGYYLQADQDRCDAGQMGDDDPLWQKPDFIFRGGATIHVDLSSGKVLRIIHKNIDDQKRLERQRGFLLGDPSAFSFAGRDDPSNSEPFALVHRACG